MYMYNETYDAVAQAAVGKESFWNKNKMGYVVASVAAGMYVGLGIILIMTIAGRLNKALAIFHPDLAKFLIPLVIGPCFGIALSLVIMAGSELFTGNNLVMSVGVHAKKVKTKSLVTIWTVSFIGNLIGSVILGGLFVLSGQHKNGFAVDFIRGLTAMKTSSPALELFFRGVICNMLVCLAVLTAIRMKSETAKLIMIWWCLFAFITMVTEHSIANMTIFAVDMFSQGPQYIGGYIYNLLFCTLGNIVGGALIIGGVVIATGRKGKNEVR